MRIMKKLEVKVDPEEIGVPASVLIFGGLQRYAVYRAYRRTQVASYTPLLAVGIAREDDPASVPGRQIHLLLRIQHRLPLPEHVQEGDPHGSDYAEHKQRFCIQQAMGLTKPFFILSSQSFHALPESRIPAVTSRFNRARGNRIFQPYSIN